MAIKDFSIIKSDLIDGKETPEKTQQKVIEVIRESNNYLQEVYKEHIPYIKTNSDFLKYKIDTVISENYYSFCKKAGFFAYFYSTDDKKQITSIGHNHRTDGCVDCSVGENCLRMYRNSSDNHDYYGNCMSVHAVMGLPVVNVNPESVIWIEGGAINVNGQFVSVQNNISSTDYKKIIYRCSMCLKSCLGKGVKTLALFNNDINKNLEETEIIFGKVEEHLSGLIICNLAQDIIDGKVKL